jgi:phosphoglucosamine mutase
MLIDAVLPDIKITRTRVGDVFVSEAIKRTGADFGGEASGTWVFPEISYCPEGIYSAARLVEILSRGRGGEGERFSDQISSMPEYAIKRGSIAYQGGMDAIEGELRSLEFSEISTIDGVRLTFDDSWALVRASGTEPLIRITVEGETADVVERLYRRIHEIIEGSIC